MNIDDPILRAGSDISNVPSIPTEGAEQIKKPNRFMSVLKGIGGVAASFIPGLGGIGGLISGGLSKGPDFGSMQAMIQQQQANSVKMLGIQHQVSNQSQEFTTVSNLLKARHDSEMSAVNNFKS